MHQKLPFNPNNGQVQIPILGQQQQLMCLGAQVAITPALKKKLDAWSKKTGIPFAEIGQTMFRIGLLGLSAHIDEPNMITAEEAQECIPLTENEKNATYE
jgi:hypothetical protein